MSYAQHSHEIDLQIARARYPEYAEKIKAWQGGPGGDDIDRLARINTRLGVMDNYLTTDSAAYDVTEQITWFRTAALLEVKVKTARESLIQKAGGDGLQRRLIDLLPCRCGPMNLLMDIGELEHGGGAQDEWIEIGDSHAAVDRVEGESQRDP